MFGERFGLDQKDFEMGLGQAFARLQKAAAQLVLGGYFGRIFPTQNLVGRCGKGLANAHERGEVGFARAGDVMAVAPLGQAGAAGDFRIRKPKAAGERTEFVS